MNYVDEVKAELAKHINVGKGLMNYYSLLVLLLGEDTTLADVHDAWAVNINQTWDKTEVGEHFSMVPFDQLKPETAAKDQKFVDAIHKTTRALKARGVKW